MTYTRERDGFTDSNIGVLQCLDNRIVIQTLVENNTISSHGG
jgi:hypothetical protein